MQPLTIKSGGLSASFTQYGASLVDLRMDGHDQSLVLSHKALSDYEKNKFYMGAIVGRFANRIRGAGFELGGKRFQLDKNWRDAHALHGGRQGIAFHQWDVVKQTDSSLTLATRDQEAQSGYPGSCDVQLAYRLIGDQTLELEICAKPDEDTPVSITAHPYFNLGSTDTILDHEFQLEAADYLPVDEDLLPTGEIFPVADTLLDFRSARKLSAGMLSIDTNFCVADERGSVQKMAVARAPDTGISMEVWSNEPGVQFYTGGGLHEIFSQYQGFCLEPQAWPDAPNQHHFPDCRVKAGETYRHKIRYVFSRDTRLV